MQPDYLGQRWRTGSEGGTLFIDEIGEMAPGLQAKLLRVLEDGHYRRVGKQRGQSPNPWPCRWPMNPRAPIPSIGRSSRRASPLR